MSKSAMVDVVRVITCADGVFAPGHLGELTQVVPFELVDAVLAETGATERRLRSLPSRVGVYFVLGLGLFQQSGARLVWAKLVAALTLAGFPVVLPSEKGLRDLRRRVGAAPLRALFEVLAGPLAQPHTRGVRYRRWRTVAFDGCASLKVPDHERNRGWLGKVRNRFGPAGYPTVMLMALAETGTRGLLGAVFGPPKAGERAYALRLMHLLKPDMLLLVDRGFDGDDLLASVAATGAQILARCRSSRRPPVLAVLDDGSYLTRIGALKLRVIEANVTVTDADGSTSAGVYRLVTTLTDHRADPAAALTGLYHERWEIESAFYALRHTLLDGRVLRSRDPAGLEQELWALLALYQAIRSVMVTAAETVPGTDPDRASFTIAMQAATDTVTNAAGIIAPPGPIDLAGHIGRQILDGLLPARRPRHSARKVKCPISRYHDFGTDHRPPASTNITTIDITIHQPPTPAEPPSWGNRWPTTQTLMKTRPRHPWRARDLGRTMGITDQQTLASFAAQMSAWSRQGLLIKTAPATYLLNHHAGLDRPP